MAYRLLGSVHEADDAVQETWLRLERSDASRPLSPPRMHPPQLLDQEV